jgi:hypothetical protein
MELQNGEITLKERLDGGTIAEIALPRTAAR